MTRRTFVLPARFATVLDQRLDALLKDIEAGLVPEFGEDSLTGSLVVRVTLERDLIGADVFTERRAS